MNNYSFNHFLREKGVPNDVRSLLYHIARAVKYINFSLRAGNTGKTDGQNCQGEEQLQLDVMADLIIQDELKKSELVRTCISEEIKEAMIFDAPRGEYTVAYDPLDGSSLVDANLAIGSIFGIWEGSELVGKTARDQVAACYAIYGPRVTFVIAIKNGGTHEFELNDVGEFILVSQDLQVADVSKYFAPGNLRASIENKRYLELIQSFILEGRTLRYSGGMVPDLHHILKKGQGIFCYPGCQKHPNGKLRLAFECAPFSFIFDQAGGMAKTVDGLNLLDKPVTKIHERTTIFIGSKQEVTQAVDFLQN
ncbi:fructose-bisphosphatase class I [bacterium DOLZORAL124_38_8]|nr:MAG: fructose-bisphosphatase class I [bacterium DOLZORAL124_38_8]